MSCDCNTLVIGEAGPQGPQGLSGINGTNGTNGVSAFTTVSGSGFTQPSEGQQVTFSVVNNAWIALGQPIYISNAGFYQVSLVSGSSSVTATLLKQDGVSPTGTVVAGLKVSPSAVATYAAPLTTLTVSGTSILQNGPVSINTSGALAQDVTIGGSTDSSLFLVKASTNRIGIGTAAPVAKLHVSGDFQVGVALSSGGGSTASFTKGATFNSLQGGTGFSASDFIVKTQSQADTLVVSASTDRVGIGTASPSRLFDVDGTGQVKAWIVNPGAVANPDGSTYVFKVWGSGNTTPLMVADAANSYVGVNISSPTVALDVSGDIKSSGSIASKTISINTSSLYVDSSSYFVGVNTSSPTVQLHVSGSSLISGNLQVSGLITGLSSATISSVNTSALNVKSGLMSVQSSTLRVGISTSAPTRTLSVNGSGDFSGSVFVADSVFVVDTATNRVGVNTSSPSTDFQVAGSCKINSDLSVSGRIYLTGSASFGNTLSVSGSSFFSDNIYVDTNVFVVDTVNNRVGVNVSPSYSLHVSGATQADSYQIESGAGKLTKFYYSVGTSNTLTSLGAGTSETFSDTVSGAAVGDFVVSSLDSVPGGNFATDVFVSSKVVSSNTVNVTYTNSISSASTYTDTVRLRHLVIRSTNS